MWYIILPRPELIYYVLHLFLDHFGAIVYIVQEKLSNVRQHIFSSNQIINTIEDMSKEWPYEQSNWPLLP